MWRMLIACWTTKATYAHSEYVAVAALPLQQWLYESAVCALQTKISTGAKVGVTAVDVKGHKEGKSYTRMSTAIEQFVELLAKHGEKRVIFSRELQ
jgi:hypothetical protein